MWTPNCGKNYSEVSRMSLAIQGRSRVYGTSISMVHCLWNMFMVHSQGARDNFLFPINTDRRCFTVFDITFVIVFYYKLIKKITTIQCIVCRALTIHYIYSLSYMYVGVVQYWEKATPPDEQLSQDGTILMFF